MSGVLNYIEAYELSRSLRMFMRSLDFETR